MLLYIYLYIFMYIYIFIYIFIYICKKRGGGQCPRPRFLTPLLYSACGKYFRLTNWIDLQEHQEYMEQMELLLEEKIMLFEENQELKERIEELVSFIFTNFLELFIYC